MKETRVNRSNNQCTLASLLADMANECGDSDAYSATFNLAEQFAIDFCPEAEISKSDFGKLINFYQELLEAHIEDANEILEERKQDIRETEQARREAIQNA